MDEPAAGTLFAVLHPQPSTVKWVPTIVNINFLPDMGRMDARWLSVGTTGSSLEVTTGVPPLLSFAALPHPVSGSASILSRGSRTFSPELRLIQ
jgi:hypothetical protein